VVQELLATPEKPKKPKSELLGAYEAKQTERLLRGINLEDPKGRKVWKSLKVDFEQKSYKLGQ